MLPQERKDAALNATGEGVWGFGMGFIAPLTVLPLLLKTLGATPVEIGLLYGIVTAGHLLTQPLGMFLLQHGAGRKRFILTYHVLAIVPLTLLMGASVRWLAPQNERAARTVLLALMAARMLSIGLIVPIWMDWIATIFTTRSRGRATGTAFACSSLGVTVSALLAAWIQKAVGFPGNYAMLHFISVGVACASLAVFAFMSSGAAAGQTPRRLRPRELLDRFTHSLGNLNFRNFLIGRALLTLGGGAAAFFAVYFKSPEGGNVSVGMVIAFGGAMTFTRAAMSYWLGSIGDRAGHKIGLVIGSLAQIACLLVAYLARGEAACLITFILLGAAAAAATVSHQNMIFETCPHDNRVAHITLSNVVLGPVIMAVPLMTGWLIKHVGMEAGFALCLIPTVLGVLWLLLKVKNPREIRLPLLQSETSPRK